MDSQQWITTLSRMTGQAHLSFTERLARADLFDMARGLADQMRRVAADKPVCIVSQDRAVVAAALLASLHSEIPVILPHAASAGTLAELQADMPYAAAIVDKDDADALPSGVGMLASEALPRRADPGAAQPRLGPDRPWVYLFTGGSTGQPKIWTKTPTNLLAETHYLVERFEITASDRILATAPPNHIYGLLYAVLVPLVSGAWVSGATPVFPHEILNTLTSTQASILVSLPVHYRSLNTHAYTKHKLRLAFSSAGPLDPADGLAFSAATGAPLFEIYGSTETGGIASRCRQRGETDLTVFEPVQVDATGECAAVSSDFISPDLPRDAQGRFRLADRLETTPQGTLRLKGRLDGIVKVGGKRVDLEMVRETIKAQKGVSDAAVFSLESEAGRDSVIAAVVEGSLAKQDLRARLQTSLGPHALPRHFKIVTRIPILATGKIDRQALRRLFR